MKTTNWIHFVGKSYYTISRFVKEAKEIGVSRAVSFEVFKKMEFGDKVFLAQKDENSTKIFGYFVIDSLVGLDHEVITDLQNEGIITKTLLIENVSMERGCGEYVIVGQYQIHDTEKLMEEVKRLDKDKIDRLMVGGEFYYLSDVNIEEDYILSDIPFRQGFRLFDFEDFRREYYDLIKITDDSTFESVNKRHIKVKGQFYMNERVENEVVIEDLTLLEIRDYKLN